MARVGWWHITRRVCCISVVRDFARVFLTALCADEYLDIHIKGRIVWRSQFEL
jgi:hypothetical protein